MEFIVLGSGGASCIPKPLCNCKICVEAREKGYPYKRCGASLYLKDINMVIDTPEDISIALNNQDINKVDKIMYSHWDPDHTLGMRVVEQISLDWYNHYSNITPSNKISVYASSGVLGDINKIRSPYGSFFDYYEKMNLISRVEIENSITISGIKISLVNVSEDKNVSVFVFEKDGKKVIYAPCDCTPFPTSELFNNADILIIGNVYPSNDIKDGRVMEDTHNLAKTLNSMQEVVNIKEKYNIKKVIVTHIEELWGKSYLDYLQLEKNYQNITFAYDGLKIKI